MDDNDPLCKCIPVARGVSKWRGRRGQQRLRGSLPHEPQAGGPRGEIRLQRAEIGRHVLEQDRQHFQEVFPRAKLVGLRQGVLKGEAHGKVCAFGKPIFNVSLHACSLHMSLQVERASPRGPSHHCVQSGK